MDDINHGSDSASWAVWYITGPLLTVFDIFIHVNQQTPMYVVLTPYYLLTNKTIKQSIQRK